MIPKLIQRQGVQHLADQEAEGEAPPSESPRTGWLGLSSSPKGSHAPADTSPIPTPSPDILELIPESVARENNVLPLRLHGRILHVAVADASNVMLRDKLQFILNKDVRLIEYPRADILRAIRRHYGQTRTESVDSMLVEFTDTAIEYTQTESEDYRYRHAPGPPASPSPLTPRRRDRLDEMPRRSKGSWGGTLLGGLLAGKAPEDEPDAMLRAALPPGEDDTPDYGTETMWYYTVEEGQRALMIRRDGRMEVIVGPKRVWKGRSRFEKMRHFVAHPGDFLVVRFRDGRQEHLIGPTDVWFDPRIHEGISRQEALQLAAKEAVIVYSRPAGAETISRRIVYGPTLFVPAPGEWLHTFAWHGSDGGSQGAKKVAKGLVFQKLWQMPDQMYHDVTDVRTADDAVLTIKLMMFFELTDIERMLETTHDPIGDFINAATSDVVDFCGHRTFEEFKKSTGELNELATYRQLTVRATQNGYRINKVVYRGYGAPDRLQAMHDQAIEARTKLQLERATEEQAQSVEDYKLNAQMARAVRRRTEQAIEVQSEIEMAQKRQEADLRAKEAERTAAPQQRRRDAETEQETRRQADERTRHHLSALKDMGVDLTAFLTQGRADRVIELRGKTGVAPHLHLDNADGEK